MTYERLTYDVSRLHRTNDRVAEMMQAEYTAPEIAAILQITVNHVRVAMTRIRRGMGEGAY